MRSTNPDVFHKWYVVLQHPKGKAASVVRRGPLRDRAAPGIWTGQALTAAAKSEGQHWPPANKSPGNEPGLKLSLSISLWAQPSANRQESRTSTRRRQAAPRPAERRSPPFACKARSGRSRQTIADVPFLSLGRLMSLLKTIVRLRHSRNIRLTYKMSSAALNPKAGNVITADQVRSKEPWHNLSAFRRPTARWRI